MKQYFHSVLLFPVHVPSTVFLCYIIRWQAMGRRRTPRRWWWKSLQQIMEENPWIDNRAREEEGQTQDLKMSGLMAASQFWFSRSLPNIQEDIWADGLTSCLVSLKDSLKQICSHENGIILINWYFPVENLQLVLDVNYLSTCLHFRKHLIGRNIQWLLQGGAGRAGSKGKEKK